jgi:glycerophosphoryl diester phosphodiesterase
MFVGSWKALFLTDLVYKVVAFVVLTPLVGGLFRGLVALSGRSILADEDILHFFAGPVGWLSVLVVGVLGLGIIALELSALLGILGSAAACRRLDVRGALRFAASRGRAVVGVTARMLAVVLLVAAPFLVLVSLVHARLLGEHDINYYLSEKPPEFWAALALGVLGAAVTVAVLLHLAMSWLFVLPVALFEHVGGWSALRISRERTAGRRRGLLGWIAGWGLASVLVSALGTSIVIAAGRALVPRSAGSLGLLAVTVGLTLALSVGINLLVNLLSNTTLAAMLYTLYRSGGAKAGPGEPVGAVTITTEPGSRRVLTRARIIGFGLVAVILAAVAGVAAIKTVRLDDRTVIIAHRGASAAAPENTLAAVRKAIEDGADWVEIDVQETADGRVVVFHDSDFMRVADVPLKIWDATMADLATIDIGSWFAPAFSGERVPTLEVVLAESKGRIGVVIELKHYGRARRLEQRVAELVEAQGMSDNVVVMSLKADSVQKMKSLRPQWHVGLLTAVAVGDLTRAEADFFAVSARLATRRFIRSAHRIGKQVHVWTINDAVGMSTMMGRQVDGLITDRPALARSVLAARAKMSVAERLLLELAGVLGVAPELGEP